MSVAMDQYHSETINFSEEKSRNDIGYDITLPSDLLLNKNIEANAKLLYGVVRNLAKRNGYCFAKNRYFSELMGVDISTVKRWLNSLVDQGYLEIHFEETPFNPKRWIYISDNFKKCLQWLKNAPPPAQNRATPYIKEKEVLNIKEKESINTLSKESSPIQENEGGRIDLKDSVKTSENLNPLKANELRPIAKQKQETEIAKSDDIRQVIDLMYSEIKRLKPNALIKPTPKWTKDIKELLKHRTPEQLEAVIKWVYQDEFWKPIVHSPAGLKKNLDMIEMRMLSPTKTSKDQKPSKSNERLGDFILKNESELRQKKQLAVGACDANEGIWFQSLGGANSFITKVYFNDPLFESKIQKAFQERSIPFNLDYVKTRLNGLQ